MSHVRHLFLIGAGGFGAEAAELAIARCGIERDLEWCGFLDENLDTQSTHAIAGRPSEWEPKPDQVFACSIGNPAVRHRVVSDLEGRGAQFVSLVDPTAYISESASIGSGSIICRNAVVSSRAILGPHSIMLGLSTIGHDSVVGSCCMLSGGVQVSGGVYLGDGVFVGSNATVLPRVRVGSNSRIGAGSTVVRKVRDGSTVFGVPAKRIAG